MGNLTSQDSLAMSYEYDDENRLVAVQVYYLDETSTPQGWRTEFKYDGRSRLRRRLEYTPTVDGGGDSGMRRGGPLSSSTAWTFDHAVVYIYDGMRVIQEREASVNTPQVSYTRGSDLSGSLEGAGGIGGLLARSSGYSSGNWTSHSYYHADGNGNITCLINASQTVISSYRYDPFGNTTLHSAGPSDENVYRFSSKEVHANSGMYYYGYRFYDPSLQRWLIGTRWKKMAGRIYTPMSRMIPRTITMPTDWYGTILRLRLRRVHPLLCRPRGAERKWVCARTLSPSGRRL